MRKRRESERAKLSIRGDGSRPRDITDGLRARAGEKSSIERGGEEEQDKSISDSYPIIRRLTRRARASELCAATDAAAVASAPAKQSLTYMYRAAAATAVLACRRVYDTLLFYFDINCAR